MSEIAYPVPPDGGTMGVFDNIYFQVDVITYMRIFVDTVQIFNGTSWAAGWGGSWWNNGTLFIVGFSPTAGWTPSTAYTFWADIDMDVGGGTKTRTIWTLTSEAGGGGGGEVLYTPIVIDPGYTPTIVTLPIFNPTGATQPTISSFTAAPPRVPYGGDPVTLSWVTADAVTLSIDNGIGDVTGLASIAVPGGVPIETMFTLTATNGDMVTQASAAVFVDPPVEPAISAFTAEPASLPFGGGTTHLAWVTTGATTLFIDHGVGVVTGLIEKDVVVAADTVFTLTATGEASLTDRGFAAVVVAPPALLFVSATPSLGHLAIQFSEDISGVFGAANDPEQWIVTNTVTGLPLEVTAVSVVTNTVTLDTAEQVTGDAYTVIIPDTIVNTTMLMVFDGPQTEGFVGVGAQPTVLNINCVDARTIIIYFSEDVVEAEALNATNYAIDNGLLPVSLTKLSASVYKMTTTRQVTGTVYTATATGIHDLAGNPIT